ncbi:hypothetical protein CTI12_AA138120 [Artemisia annua]|uniref:HAT C-terminal dimerisation domain-containing protein n=1 Tax=Artemisia annua TaxID=35608 RepID=A0A2U1PLU5_ARTAN|nr:hypothetical protein CTI12_AA138120 [Artemisia annua]
MLRAQYAKFHMKKGFYSLPDAQIDAVTMDPIDWWSTYDSETPELAEIAKKVLSQPLKTLRDDIVSGKVNLILMTSLLTTLIAAPLNAVMILDPSNLLPT